MKSWIDQNKDLLKMWAGTLVVVASAAWGLSHQMHSMEARLSERINGIDKRLVAVETILLMQGHPIRSMAAKNQEVSDN